MNSDGRGSGLHLATVAHVGRLWDVYVEFDDDPERPEMYRARLRFDPPGVTESGGYRTTVIIIEDSIEEALARARTFNDHQLQGLLRSVLPENGDGA
jgi:hypothetical protein